MKKRILLFALCIAALVTFAACQHVHEFSDWEVEREPTCESAGLKVRECRCGEEDDKEIPQLKHDYESKITTEAACEVEGVTTFTCKLCKDTYTEPIAALKHQYETSEEKAATCHADGSKTVTCQLCEDTKTEVIPQLIHDFKLVSETAATCTKEGAKNYTCQLCEDTKTETLDKIDHDYQFTKENAASCQGAGAKIYTCSMCKGTKSEAVPQTTYTATELHDMYVNTVGEVITYDKNGDGLALGTCFAISADGKLVTNYHVIEDAYSAQVTIAGKTYDVQKVLAYDTHIDIAVLKINASGLKPSTVCAKTHKVGETVYAFGSSKGLTATFSRGMITNAQRDLGDGVNYIQHDAAISSGNSGGPLINSYGEVIGINTLTFLDSQNLNIAISMAEMDNLDYSKPMTLAEVCEEECNAYKKLVNYVISEGEWLNEYGYYDLLLDSFYSDDYSYKYEFYASYWPEDGTLWLNLYLFDMDSDDYSAVYFDLDSEVSGVYAWGYYDSDDYDMDGTLYASSFDDDTLLGYSSNNIYNSTLRTSIRKLASSMMNLLIYYLEDCLYEIDITAGDLGFKNYN